MNKKLLFATMSLAALTACTSDDFESQKIAQEVSPVQFEVINDNEAATRATMDGDKIVWSAKDGDLFTLYHGAANLGDVTGYQNATYKATANVGEAATLTTPSMILDGGAIMVWPVDTMFRIGSGDNLTLTIPAVQENIEDNIPYVSDQIEILPYGDYSGTHLKGAGPATESNSLNTAGKDRKYPVFMRPMASQLTVKADYAGTNSPLEDLYTGTDPIDEISVSSIVLYTAASDKFTTEIPVTFANPSGAIRAKWDADVPTNNWKKVTGLNKAAAVATSATLTAKGECLDGIDGCKVLVLPQPDIDAGDLNGAAAVVVNTRYGKVVVAPNGIQGSQYAAAPVDEAADAWGRYIPDAQKQGYENKSTTKNAAGLYKYTSTIANGMMQTINTFSNATYTSGTANGEQVGVATTRYVKVLLTHLDMNGLHVDNDKWLRDAARVWKKYGLQSATIWLDGTAGEFEISQNTIDVINEVNATATGGKYFYVTPCNVVGEACNTIVITGGNNIKDLTFIKSTGKTAAVALKAGETWKWSASSNNTVKISDDNVPALGINTGISKIINRGTFESDATATIKVAKDDGTADGAQINLPFENAKGATWNVKANVTLAVQFNVTNYGTVNIAANAQYRQDGNAGDTYFINEANAKPGRFNKDAVAGDDTEIGLVDNYGVFATVSPASGLTKGYIFNYGLIEHRTADAKTYITHNMTEATDAGYAADATFANPFDATVGSENKMGRINLTFDNRNEDNISISAAGAAAQEGFVSVTVTSANAPASGVLDGTATDDIGKFVNYIIIKGGITEVSTLNNQFKYVEFDSGTTEISWAVNNTYDGMMVLSPVNIKLGTTVNVKRSIYLGADMFVAGTLQYNGGGIAAGLWDGYYGDTQDNVATKYITF